MHLAIYKKTHKEVQLKLHLRLHLKLHLARLLRLHLSCACIALVGALIMHKKAKNNTSNGGLDNALEVTLHGRLKVALKSAP